MIDRLGCLLDSPRRRVRVTHSVAWLLVGAALLAVTVGLTIAPGASEDPHLVRLRRITYSDIAPYLDARHVVQDGLLKVCAPNNFARLPRDPVLETLADIAARDYPYMISPELRRTRTFPAEGDSPWGFFARENVKEAMLPYFIKAKHFMMDAYLARVKAERERAEKGGHAPG